MSINSANPPFILDPISFRLRHRLYSLLSQYLQFKHGTMGETATLVPDFKKISLPLTTETTSFLISPQISCPKITGGVTFRCPFRNIRTSYPQTAQAFSLRIILSLSSIALR